MMKMRFEPATDTAGKAVPSSFSRRVNWLLTSARAFASSAIEVEMRRDPKGGRRCRVS
jgi:hypothetical protein